MALIQGQSRRRRTLDVSDDSDAWEDLRDEKPRSASPAGSSSRASAGTAKKRRPPSQQTVYIAGSPKKGRRSSVQPTPARSTDLAPRAPRPPREPALNITREDLSDAFSKGFLYTCSYVADILGTSIVLLKKPLGVLVFLLLFSFLMTHISHALRNAFSPLCILPGFGWICTPSVPRAYQQGKQTQLPPKWADYPRLMDVQSQTFETLLDEAVDGPGLALEIKKAEMATADLTTLVRVSNLKSRDMVARTLSEFVDDARKAGRGLQRFSAKVGGAIDNVVAVNDYALHAIEAANSKSTALSIWPFSRGELQTREVVMTTFNGAMDTLSANMQRLVLEAQSSITALDRLEQRLFTLHEIVAAEDSSLSDSKAEILSQLWTMLGGNKKPLRNVEKHLSLLRDVGQYRQRALAHVVGALSSLQLMEVDLEDLRERVAAPELVGSDKPVEVHIKAIQSGLERIQEGRIKAREKEEEVVRRIMFENELPQIE